MFKVGFACCQSGGLLLLTMHTPIKYINTTTSTRKSAQLCELKDSEDLWLSFFLSPSFLLSPSVILSFVFKLVTFDLRSCKLSRSVASYWYVHPATFAYHSLCKCKKTGLNFIIQKTSMWIGLLEQMSQCETARGTDMCQVRTDYTWGNKIMIWKYYIIILRYLTHKKLLAAIRRHFTEHEVTILNLTN